VALNVVSYTTTPHLLSLDPGVPDDWTLGPNQLAWLESALATSTAKWKFLFIHHTVGGKAGDDVDSAYGRGGGQAAYVGEQATVHALMLQYGVQIFFYGHDHVFTDMVVDGIHYSEPGSAGAPWLFTADLTGYKQAWLDSGWGKVTVAPGSVDVQFYSTTGSPITGYTLE
jgi:3',5'-cyclic AMP phosphodiesterase CpdA